MHVLLLVLVAIPVWVYAGYPMVLFLLRHAVRRAARPLPALAAPDRPRVTLLVTARNEEGDIAARLTNALQLDRPAGGFEILVASDGSTDRTDTIVESFAARGVRLVRGPGGGKSAAQNAAFQAVRGDVVVFSDANNHYRPDALTALVAPFADPEVGCTVGRVEYVNRDRTPVAAGEGLYWRYELYLRRLESDLGILAVGSGPIMAVRREFLAPLDPNESEDFALPLRVVLAGRRVADVPGAVSVEVLYQDSARPMYRSRVRIVGKDLRTLWRHRRALDPRRNPLLALGLASHKLLRWNVGFVLAALFATSAALAPASRAAAALLVLQALAYALAAWGAAAERGIRAPRLATTAFFFVLVNAAAVHGVLRMVAGRTSGRWEPVRREASLAAGVAGTRSSS